MSNFLQMSIDEHIEQRNRADIAINYVYQQRPVYCLHVVMKNDAGSALEYIEDGSLQEKSVKPVILRSVNDLCPVAPPPPGPLIDIVFGLHARKWTISRENHSDQVFISLRIELKQGALIKTPNSTDNNRDHWYMIYNGSLVPVNYRSSDSKSRSIYSIFYQAKISPVTLLQGKYGQMGNITKSIKNDIWLMAISNSPRKLNQECQQGPNDYCKMTLEKLIELREKSVQAIEVLAKEQPRYEFYLKYIVSANYCMKLHKLEMYNNELIRRPINEKVIFVIGKKGMKRRVQSHIYLNERDLIELPKKMHVKAEAITYVCVCGTLIPLDRPSNLDEIIKLYLRKEITLSNLLDYADTSKEADELLKQKHWKKRWDEASGRALLMSIKK